MASSDDDMPVWQRDQRFVTSKNKPVVPSSDDDSPLPSWLANHKAPTKAAGVLSITLIDTNSDSDIKEVISPVKLLSQSAPPKASVHPAAQLEDTTDLNDDTNAQPKPRHESQGIKIKAPKGKAPRKGQPKPSYVDVSQAEDDPQAAQQQDAPGATTAQPAPLGNISSRAPSSIPIVIPDRMSQAKILLELESKDEVHGATDLSGDSGAIGRVLVVGGPGSEQLQIDLKGVLYNATIVPCPVSVAVVNVGPTEAKFEALFSEFAQLREDARFTEAGKSDMNERLLGDDDDELYHDAGPGGDEGGAPGGGPGRKKNRAPGAGGKPKLTAAARKPRGGGVKKPTGRGPAKTKKKS